MFGDRIQIDWKEVEETIKGVSIFKYLWRPLEQSYNDWPEVIWNIRQAHQFWNRLGVILRREGADPVTSMAFYRAVV